MSHRNRGSNSANRYMLIFMVVAVYLISIGIFENVRPIVPAVVTITEPVTIVPIASIAPKKDPTPLTVGLWEIRSISHDESAERTGNLPIILILAKWSDQSDMPELRTVTIFAGHAQYQFCHQNLRIRMVIGFVKNPVVAGDRYNAIQPTEAQGLIFEIRDRRLLTD